MKTNREQMKRGTEQRARNEMNTQGRLDRRREDMQEAEGHAGSVPRGNQKAEREIMGTHRIAWERVLGH